MEVISKIYVSTTPGLHKAILTERVKANQNQPKVVPSMKDVLTVPDFRTATYVGIYLALANQLTGTAGISIYSETIFDDLNKSGLNMSPSLGSTLIGMASLIG